MITWPSCPVTWRISTLRACSRCARGPGLELFTRCRLSHIWSHILTSGATCPSRVSIAWYRGTFSCLQARSAPFIGTHVCSLRSATRPQARSLRSPPTRFARLLAPVPPSRHSLSHCRSGPTYFAKYARDSSGKIKSNVSTPLGGETHFGPGAWFSAAGLRTVACRDSSPVLIALTS